MLRSFSRFLFLSVFFVSFSSNTSSAQILSRLTKSVESAINNEINKVGDKVAERLVQELIESIFSGKKTESDSLSMYEQDSVSSDDADVIGSLFGSLGSSSTEKVDKVFDFDYKVAMAISSEGNTNNMTYYFPEQGSFILVEMSSVKVITDFETGDSYTILNDKLTTFNMQKVIEKSMSKAIDENQVYKITKTGKSEKISGYLCYEYILESEENTVNSWITTEFVHQDFTSSAMISKIRAEYDTDIPDGFAMRMISKDNKDGKVATIEVVDIQSEKLKIDLSTF